MIIGLHNENNKTRSSIYIPVIHSNVSLSRSYQSVNPKPKFDSNKTLHCLLPQTTGSKQVMSSNFHLIHHKWGPGEPNTLVFDVITGSAGSKKPSEHWHSGVDCKFYTKFLHYYMNCYELELPCWKQPHLLLKTLTGWSSHELSNKCFQMSISGIEAEDKSAKTQDKEVDSSRTAT
jgi:hypothetical protein